MRSLSPGALLSIPSTLLRPLRRATVEGGEGLSAGRNLLLKEPHELRVMLVRRSDTLLLRVLQGVTAVGGPKSDDRSDGGAERCVRGGGRIAVERAPEVLRCHAARQPKP